MKIDNCCLSCHFKITHLSIQVPMKHSMNSEALSSIFFPLFSLFFTQDRIKYIFIKYNLILIIFHYLIYFIKMLHQIISWPHLDQM